MAGEAQLESTSKEQKLQALRADYTYIIDHLCLGEAVGSTADQSVVSLLRREETGDTLAKMKEGSVVISGTAGVGKTSLLYQLSGVAQRENQPFLLLSAESLVREDDSKQMESTILKIAQQYGFTATTFSDLTNLLKESGAMLLIDELRYAIGEEGIKTECEPIANLVAMAADKRIPLALVIHQDPKILEAIGRRLPLIREAPIIIPRDLTREEIKTVMLSGAVCKLDKEPRKPQVLTVHEEAVDTLIRLTGHKPICVNRFIAYIYRQQKENPNPTSVITAELIKEYWKQAKYELISDYAFMRGPSFSIPVLKINRQLETFIETFGLPKWPNDRYKIDRAIGAMTGDEKYEVDVSSVSAGNIDLWGKLGLIREENGKLAVDGLIPAICIARLAALMG